MFVLFDPFLNYVSASGAFNIEKIGGTMPEDLPVPEKSIQQIEKEQMKRLKDKAKKGKLMLDE